MKDQSYLDVKFLRRVPKGCPKYDVIKAKLRNASGKEINLYLTPDEAMFFAGNLIQASLEAVVFHKGFSETYIAPRFKDSGL